MVAPTSVNFARSILTERAAGPCTDNEIELKILHGGIEDFLHRRIEPVNLVDEQHVALLEIGEERGKIAGLGNDRAGRGAKVYAELARHDLRKRRLAEPGRADEQHMVERLLARPRGLDENGEVRARLLLADEFGEALRAQRASAPSSSRRSAVTRRAVRARGCGRAQFGPHSVRSRLYLFGSSSPIAATTGPFAVGTITRALRS